MRVFKIGTYTFLFILAFALVTGAFPGWTISFPANVTYFQEDSYFTFNISNYISDGDGDALTYTVTPGQDGGFPIKSSLHGSRATSFFTWINLNSSTGILSFNSTINNHTQEYNISIDVSDGTGSAGARPFIFVVNATNDYPVFSSISANYTLNKAENFYTLLTASDEEKHYPLHFNVSFFNNCNIAEGSTRNNCTLFSFNFVSNTSASINITPGENDVGIYRANISVMDYGANYTCTSTYCESNYRSNRTTFYSQVVTFNVLSTLGLNVTDCQNKQFTEGVSSSCLVRITTQGENDSLNYYSTASLINQQDNPFNSSWFYSSVSSLASNFTKIVNVTILSSKREVGNWSINFTVNDITQNQETSAVIYVYVNRSGNDGPELVSIGNQNVSIDQNYRINVTVYDDDFLIPDKINGYNETLTFTTSILNASNLSQSLSLSNFSLQIINIPQFNTNKTTAKFEFTLNSSDAGIYRINVSVRDREGAFNESIFNLTVLSNRAPVWNSSIVTTYNLNESQRLYLNLSRNVSDPDGDVLIYSFTNSSPFSSFSINASTGVINFTATDYDIGMHLVNLTVSDGYLTDDVQFTITINNINDPVYLRPLQGNNVTPGSNIYNGINVNVSEGNLATLFMFVEDDDLKIPDFHKGSYNESFIVNLTIIGNNTNLFNFSLIESNFEANTSRYRATFTPNQSDIGYYRISLNVSDRSNSSYSLNFNLTVLNTDNAPVITTSIQNYSYSINENIFINFNSVDDEDGSDSSGLLTYALRNISYVGLPITINSTSGVINVSLNVSYAGAHDYNLSVTDSSGLSSSRIFRINVYDYPRVHSPNVSLLLSAIENSSFNVVFNVTHSVKDSLNYTILIDGQQRNFTLGSGNGNLYTVSIPINFTEETTCTGNRAFSLNVSNPKLSNLTAWNIQINHTNHPVELIGTLGGSDGVESGVSPLTLDLDDYFLDYDSIDSCINQSLGFSYNLVPNSTSGGSVSISIVNKTNLSSPSISFSASESARANYSINVYEYNSSDFNLLIRNLTSGNFSLILSTSETTGGSTGSSSGGGGGGSTITPVSLKLVLPGPVRILNQQTIKLPVKLENTGRETLKNVNVSKLVTMNGIPLDGVLTYFDVDYFSSISSGESKNLELTVFANTNQTGEFEIIVNATSTSPRYNDWGKVYLTIETVKEISDRILFTEELVIGNPECAELKEVVDEARDLFNKGDITASNNKLDEAINGCKNAIAQRSGKSSIRENITGGIFGYVGIASVFALLLGLFYYGIRRRFSLIRY